MYEFQEDSWLTHSLFPSFPSLGPRNQYDTLGGNPGKWILCLLISQLYSKNCYKLVLIFIPSAL